MVKVILAPGLLAHIRKSIIEGNPTEELSIKNSSLKTQYEWLEKRLGSRPT